MKNAVEFVARLFLTAFSSVYPNTDLSNPPEDLVNVGRKIVERCANVPLAIRVAGSLLYGQDKRTWISFQDLPITKFEENKSGIMPILKLSYHQLQSPLKTCFGYCALFPKDYKIEKKTLMRLWMAQGYIPSSDQRSMQDVAEEYFLILLRRCFFQDVEEDEYGEIYSCKIHDLMHDVAQEVVGKEISMGDANVDMVDKKVRHFSSIRREYQSYTINKTRIRSYFQLGPHLGVDGKMGQLSLDALLANWKYLRVLDLSGLNIKSLSSSLGELIHLRYLNLASNRNLEMLPKQITNLYNLQTLNLCYCKMLRELPKDMRKLVKLRALDIHGCDGLSYMPRGMGNLCCLEELNMFVVGETNFSPHKALSELENLKALTNLKGYLKIKFGIWKKKGGNEEKEGGWDGGCLSNKPHLTGVELMFSKERSEGKMKNDERIIEELQPHSNLNRLDVKYYKGVRMPKWAREDTLSNLVKMIIHNCINLESLGCLGTLQHLKYLHLDRLLNLKWLSENKNARESSSDMEASCAVSEPEQEFLFFPSLETLVLWGLPKLKEWWRGVGMGDNQQLLRLPQLKKLHMWHCSNLTAIVECPELENLNISNFHTKLGITLIRRKMEKKEKGDGDEKHLLKEATIIPKLRSIEIDNLAWLNLQHIDMLQSLEIRGCKEVQSLEEGREVFYRCSSSLSSLIICNCPNLRSVSGGLEHLTALETLEIIDCPKLRLSEGESVDVDVMPWESLNHSLRTLKLLYLPQLVNLPSWIQDLSVLQNLEIRDCENLEMLPSWMPKLTSLSELHLIGNM